MRNLLSSIRQTRILILRIINLVLVVLLFVLCTSANSQSTKQSENRNKTVSVIIKNPSRESIIITRIGAKISNVESAWNACMGGPPIYMKRLGLYPEATYGIKIVPVSDKEEEEIIQNAEPAVIIEANKLSQISVTVFPDISYLMACVPAFHFDVTIFLVYKNTVSGKEDRITASPISYSEEDFLSLKPPTSQLGPEELSRELKNALTHANPAIRATALKEFYENSCSKWFGCKDSAVIVEGIVLNKLENDPSEEVKVVAAYIAGQLQLRSAGKKILDLLKTTQDASVVNVYCYALAKLAYADAVDELFNKVFDLTLKDSDNRNYSVFEQSRPHIALIESNLPGIVPPKARALFIKHRSWSKNNATIEQKKRFAMLVDILLSYRDIASIPMLLEIAGEPGFLSPDNFQLSYWRFFVVWDEASRSEKLVNDKFMLGLRPILEMLFNSAGGPVGEVRFDSYARAKVFSLLCRMPQNMQQVENLIVRGFRDKDTHVKMEAVELSEIFNLKKFTQNIIDLFKEYNNDKDFGVERYVLCKTLKKFEPKTKLCPDVQTPVDIE